MLKLLQLSALNIIVQGHERTWQWGMDDFEAIERPVERGVQLECGCSTYDACFNEAPFLCNAEGRKICLQENSCHEWQVWSNDACMCLAAYQCNIDCPHG